MTVRGNTSPERGGRSGSRSEADRVGSTPSQVPSTMSGVATLPLSRGGIGGRRMWASVFPWLLLLPAAVLLAAFTHYPILATVYATFFVTRRNGPALFVGLDNYRAMLDDPVFW